MRSNLAVVAALFVTRLGIADPFVVVRNAKASSAHVTKSELRAMYTGKTKTWGGAVVTAVVRSEDDPVFGAFADTEFGVTAKTLLSKIKQEVFKGEMNKPIKAGSDQDVLQHVGATPGSLGVISPAAAKQLPDGVAVLQVTGD